MAVADEALKLQRQRQRRAAGRGVEEREITADISAVQAALDELERAQPGEDAA